MNLRSKYRAYSLESISNCFGEGEFLYDIQTSKMKYLFNHTDQIRKKIKGKNVFIFLDYDGTITPLVKTPEEARLSSEVKRLLLKIVQNPRFKLAVISGRALKDIKKKVGIKGITYAGNHGLEIEGRNLRLKGLVRDRQKIILRKFRKVLKEKLSLFKGVMVEDKGLSISIHYRLAERRKIPLIKKEIEKIFNCLNEKKEFDLKDGKMIKEIRPKVNWDKGKAVKWIIAKEGKGYFPIYIGDDITDEDAFQIVKEIRGVTVYVGCHRKSFAEYFLYNSQEVKEFLKGILWQN